ncbi:aromatic acid exporter family protein [Pseudolactococcus yaeyamensis]
MKIFPNDFKIGARTVKTVIAASLAISIANLLKLDYATAAGIIAILSVGNTKKSTYQSGKNRLLNFLAAMIISVVLFSILGHHVLVFGLFLLIFIPYSAACGMSEGIAPNAVLVTHLLMATKITPQLLLNEFLLNFIAISLAFIVNLKMPNFQTELSEREKRIEHHFRDLFKRLSFIMAKKTEQAHFLHKVEDLEQYISESLTLARTHLDNQFGDGGAGTSYDYFAMRATQVEIFHQIAEILLQIEVTVQKDQLTALNQLFKEIGKSYAKDNDGKALMQQVKETLDIYRASDLPKNREEFEARARLFQILQLIQTFIQIKRDYILESEV